jgi:DNA-binding HxlR family transcriptional regulator
MFDFEKLDKMIHEKWRLAIMALLASRRSWSFQDLKQELGMSDGNLITHLRALHKQGWVTMTKQMVGRPRTTYALTAKGGTAFRDHISALEHIVKRCKPK